MGPEVTVAPYIAVVPTTAADNGTVWLTAVARDTSGNRETSAAVIVTLNNPVGPIVAFTSPATMVAGTVSVTATATGNVRIVGVRFKVDGNNLGAEDTAAPYSVAWNTTTVPNGDHVLTATARDAAGHTMSITQTVSVLNPRTISPSSYAVTSGSYQSGGISALTGDDGSYLVIRSTDAGAQRTAATELGVAGATGPASRLDVRTIVKSSVSGTAVGVEIYDWTSATWTLLGSSSIGTSEVTHTSSVSSPARYIDPAGNVRLRLDSTRSASTYSLSIEQVQVTVTYGWGRADARPDLTLRPAAP